MRECSSDSLLFSFFFILIKAKTPRNTLFSRLHALISYSQRTKYGKCLQFDTRSEFKIQLPAVFWPQIEKNIWGENYFFFSPLAEPSVSVKTVLFYLSRGFSWTEKLNMATWERFLMRQRLFRLLAVLGWKHALRWNRFTVRVQMQTAAGKWLPVKVAISQCLLASCNLLFKFLPAALGTRLGCVWKSGHLRLWFVGSLSHTRVTAL